MKRYGQVLDIRADDLEGLFRQTEMQAFRRHFGDTRCGDIMSRDILSVEFATELAAVGLSARIQALLSRSPQSHSDKPEVVGQIMSAPLTTAQGSTTLVELVAALYETSLAQRDDEVLDERRGASASVAA